MNTFTEYFYSLSLDGTCDEYDFGGDGCVDHYSVIEITDEDRVLFPNDIRQSDSVVILHVDDLGFKTASAQEDANELIDEYNAFCESMEDVDA